MAMNVYIPSYVVMWRAGPDREPGGRFRNGEPVER